MLGRHVKVAVIILMAVVVAVEGYFVYRFYEVTSSYDPAVAGAAPKEARMSEATVGGKNEEGTVQERADPPDKAVPEGRSTGAKGAATFVHRTAPQNTNANSTYLDHPSANDNPDAFVLITPVWEPEGSEVNNARPIGVWYNVERARWAIYNQDLSLMPSGAVFNVTVSEQPGGALFVHRVASEEVPDNTTYLDHPLTNGEPEAILQVTPNWNPGGRGGVYDDHPVGTFYDPDEKKWAVFNQDAAPMPNGAAFNVAVPEVSVPAT